MEEKRVCYEDRYGGSMKAKIGCLSAVGAAMLLAGTSKASMLNGSVSFDPATNLYTYSYVVDNISGPAAITELAILINDQVAALDLHPDAHTDPPGTSFWTGISGSSANPPVNESGTFWEWEYVYVPVGTEASGFSFTTAAPPVVSSANNYFLFADTFTQGPDNSGIVEFGPIVAPLVTPEPGTWEVAAGALLILACFQRRGRRSYEPPAPLAAAPTSLELGLLDGRPDRTILDKF